MLKKCSRCKKVKDISEFGKNRVMEDKLHYYCKECQKDLHKNYRSSEKGKVAIRKAARKYHNSEKGKTQIREKIGEGYFLFGKSALSRISNGAKRRGRD